MIIAITTKHRFRNKYALQIRERDHHPPHAHLVGAGFDVLIDLETLQSIGVWPPGVKAEVLAFIAENQNDLMEEWKRWHP